MDPALLKWILENVFNFTKESRPAFLKTLKERPEAIKGYIHSKLWRWPVVACFTLGETFLISSYETAAQEVLEAVQKKFSKELEALPA